jgi:hypothetical protein
MKKLVGLTVFAVALALCLAALPSYAVGYCNTCWGKPPSTQCACPPPYFAIIITCGEYPVACDPMTPYLTGPSFLAPEPLETSMYGEPVVAPLPWEDCDDSTESEG